MNEVPARARTAAILFLVYGSLALLNAVVWQVGGGQGSSTGLLRSVVRVAGIVLIAIGLLRGARWAWMFGVAFPGLWLLLGAIRAVGLVVSGTSFGVSPFGAVLLLGALVTLAAGWALLLTREVRQAYRNG